MGHILGGVHVAWVLDVQFELAAQVQDGLLNHGFGAVDLRLEDPAVDGQNLADAMGHRLRGVPVPRVLDVDPLAQVDNLVGALTGNLWIRNTRGRAYQNKVTQPLLEHVDGEAGICHDFRRHGEVVLVKGGVAAAIQIPMFPCGIGVSSLNHEPKGRAPLVGMEHEVVAYRATDVKV